MFWLVVDLIILFLSIPLYFIPATRQAGQTLFKIWFIFSVFAIFHNHFDNDKKMNAMQNEIDDLKKQMAEQQKIEGPKLSGEFPQGYQLVGLLKGKIIPAEKPSMHNVILWDSAKIISATRDYIEILLPDVFIFPEGSSIIDSTVTLRNVAGSMDNSFAANGWTIRTKVLSSTDRGIIIAIGLVKDQK